MTMGVGGGGPAATTHICLTMTFYMEYACICFTIIHTSYKHLIITSEKNTPTGMEWKITYKETEKYWTKREAEVPETKGEHTARQATDKGAIRGEYYK